MLVHRRALVPSRHGFQGARVRTPEHEDARIARQEAQRDGSQEPDTQPGGPDQLPGQEQHRNAHRGSGGQKPERVLEVAAASAQRDRKRDHSARTKRDQRADHSRQKHRSRVLSREESCDEPLGDELLDERSDEERDQEERDDFHGRIEKHAAYRGDRRLNLHRPILPSRLILDTPPRGRRGFRACPGPGGLNGFA